MAAPHMSRESTVKLLEALKGAKIKRVADLRNAEIATALMEVVAKVRSSDVLPYRGGMWYGKGRPRVPREWWCGTGDL